METFFFYFGVVCFVLIIGFLFLSGLVSGWIDDLYRFFVRAKQKRRDKAEFEVGEIVEWKDDSFKVTKCNFEDMNGDKKFHWTYSIEILEKDYNKKTHRATVYGEGLKTSKLRKIRKNKIDKILEETL